MINRVRRVGMVDEIDGQSEFRRLDLRVWTQEIPSVKVKVIIENNRGDVIKELEGDAIIGALHKKEDVRALAIGFIPNVTLSKCVESINQVVGTVRAENESQEG